VGGFLQILAVSQRMIELVRLLRAAQGMDPNIESLASLFHVDQWPLIIEAIKYVSGYEEGSARNPQYIYDVGQVSLKNITLRYISIQ